MDKFLLLIYIVYLYTSISLLIRLIKSMYNVISIFNKVKNFALVLAINIVLQETVIITLTYVTYLANLKGIFAWR